MTELAAPPAQQGPSVRRAPLGRLAPFGAGAHRQRAGLSHATRSDRKGFWFVLPFVTAFLLFMVVPLLYAIYQSFYTTQLIGGTHFAGASNYTATLQSANFWSSLLHVVIFGAIQIPIMLALAFFLAAVFDLGIVKLAGLWRTILFIPFAVPGVVAAVMWQFLLQPQFGPFVHLANGLGFHSTNYFSPGLIWPTIFVIVIWEWTGYTMIIFYTALKAVPPEVVESAVIDGSSVWKIITGVKLPMVRSATTMLIFINTIGALQMFVEPQILANFQPEAINTHFTPTIYIYNTGVAGQEYGLGAAAAVILALVIVTISMSLMLLRARRGEAL